MWVCVCVCLFFFLFLGLLRSKTPRAHDDLLLVGVLELQLLTPPLESTTCNSSGEGIRSHTLVKLRNNLRSSQRDPEEQVCSSCFRLKQVFWSIPAVLFPGWFQREMVVLNIANGKKQDDILHAGVLHFYEVLNCQPMCCSQNACLPDKKDPLGLTTFDL